MKLTTQTLSILTNFANINDNVKLVPGRQQKTMTTMKNVLCEATLDEELDIEEPICLYSLSKFLKLYQALPSPTLEVVGTHSIIIHGCDGGKLSYRLTDESIITTPPAKQLTIPSEDVVFELTERDIKNCVKVASALSVPDLSIVGDGENIYLQVRDKKNSGSDSYEISVGETELTFCANLKIENLKMKSGDYQATLSSKNLMRLEDNNLIYFLALEPDSSWETTTEPEVEEKEVVTMSYEETEEYNSRISEVEVDEELLATV